MQNYELSTEEIQSLKAAHKTSKQVSAYTAYRIHVIILLGMGMAPAEVSEIILLDKDTVTTYFGKYASGRLISLLKTSYQGSSKKLTPNQIIRLQEELDNNVHLTTKSVFLKIKKDNDLIFFMDAIHPVHNIQAAYGWCVKSTKMIINHLREERPFHQILLAL